MNLIHSKIRLPRWRADLLHRPRLVEYLQANLARKLIVVVAPAGYGKTTLLLDLVHHHPTPACWLALDTGDRDPRVFLDYLVAAIRQRFPAFGARTLTALADYRPARAELARLVGILVNELYETVPDDCLLLLDNYEAIDDSPDISHLLEALLRYLPDHVRLILASRTFPSRSAVTLPLIAQGEVAGVSGSLLRFQPAELVELAQQVYGRHLDPATAADIVERCEGWIMGIQLTSHVFWRSQLDEILPPQTNQSLLFDYLADQVFSRLTPAQQRFLVRTSVLQPLTVDLASAVADVDAGAMLQDLADTLPLFVMGLEEGAYRYHALFSEFLQQWLTREPGLLAEIHRSVGEALEARGSLVEAIGHYRLAGDIEGLRRVVGPAARVLHRSGRWDTLRRLVAELPPHARTPELLIVETIRLQSQGDPTQALALLAEVESHGDPTWYAHAQVRRASIWVHQGRYRPAIDLLRSTVDLASADPLTVGEAHRVVGLSYHGLRQLEAAVEHLHAALEVFRSINSVYYVGLTQHDLGMVYRKLGQLARAEAARAEAISAFESLGATEPRLNTLNSMAMAQYDLGDYSRTLELLRDVASGAQQFGYTRVQSAAMLGIGDVQKDCGLLDEAGASYRAGLAIAQQIGFTFLIVYAYDALGNVYRLQRDMGRARSHLQAGLSLARDSVLPYEMAICTMSLGLLDLDTGQLDSAQSQIEQACQSFTAVGTRKERAIAEFHLARLAYRGGHFARARSHLATTAALATDLGYDSFVVVAAAADPPLLRWIVRDRTDDPFWESILRRLEPDAAPLHDVHQPPAVVVSPLEITAFGQTHIRRHGEECLPGWTTLRELFFYLLANRADGVHRDRLLATFWPDTPPARAGRALKVALHRLRRSICATHHEAGWYSLALPEGYHYDVGEFERLVSAAQPNGAMPPDRLRALERAVALYTGHYLTDYDSDWVQLERDRLKQLYLQALTDLGDYFVAADDPGQALEYYQRILVEDAYQELTHQAIMRCYMTLGDRHRAIQHFRSMAQSFQRDLGLEPTAESTYLYEQILEHTP